MEATYAQPPPHPSYSLGSNMPPNDPGYRRDVAGPSYHTAPPPQHIQNGQQYPFNPNPPPVPTQRTSVAEPSQVVDAVAVSDPSNPPATPNTTPPPPSHSMIELGRRYTLDVVQQPRRARMCGFGDKDRRPITPPPCIRLVITDALSGAEIDTNDIEHGLFVLNVDLWSADGLREVNLVRHSSSSPAISTVTPTSYAITQGVEAPVYPSAHPTPGGQSGVVRDPMDPYQYPQQQSNPHAASQVQSPYNPYPQQPQVNPYAQSSQQQLSSQGHYGAPHQQQPPAGYPQRPSTPNYASVRFQEPPNHHIYFHSGNAIHPLNTPPRPQDLPPFNPTDLQRMPVTSAPSGMFTRNLIGSLSASAFRLSDPNDKIGIWFVLQDLSVRTEGNFRLRFSFVNVGTPSKTPNGNPANQLSIINTGKAPILASCYSDVFTVYSAKKFPGVVESTPLSKCFATQGIKIPIRKDGPSKGANREEYEEE